MSVRVKHATIDHCAGGNHGVGGADCLHITHGSGWASYDFCVVSNCHRPPPSARHRLPLEPVMLSIDPSPVQIESLLQIVKQRK